MRLATLLENLDFAVVTACTALDGAAMPGAFQNRKTNPLAMKKGQSDASTADIQQFLAGGLSEIGYEIRFRAVENVALLLRAAGSGIGVPRGVHHLVAFAHPFCP